MEKTHDTFIDLHAGTPGWFVWTARLLPVGIFGQFVSAGLGLFSEPDLLGLHGGIGMSLLVLPLVLFSGSLLVVRLRGLAWWAGAVVALHAVQIALAAGANPLPLSFHPANGALLLAASLVLLVKTERRAMQPSHAR